MFYAIFFHLPPQMRSTLLVLLVAHVVCAKEWTNCPSTGSLKIDIAVQNDYTAGLGIEGCVDECLINNFFQSLKRDMIHHFFSIDIICWVDS